MFTAANFGFQHLVAMEVNRSRSSSQTSVDQAETKSGDKPDDAKAGRRTSHPQLSRRAPSRPISPVAGARPRMEISRLREIDDVEHSAPRDATPVGVAREQASWLSSQEVARPVQNADEAFARLAELPMQLVSPEACKMLKGALTQALESGHGKVPSMSMFAHAYFQQALDRFVTMPMSAKRPSDFETLLQSIAPGSLTRDPPGLGERAAPGLMLGAKQLIDRLMLRGISEHSAVQTAIRMFEQNNGYALNNADDLDELRRHGAALTSAGGPRIPYGHMQGAKDALKAILDVLSDRTTSALREYTAIGASAKRKIQSGEGDPEKIVTKEVLDWFEGRFGYRLTHEADLAELKELAQTWEGEKPFLPPPW